MIFCKIIFWVFITLWAFSNGYVTYALSAKEMKADFIDGQCVIGKVAANLFYAPAWLLKCVKHLIK